MYDKHRVTEEPDEGKLSCPVLRGGNSGNVVSLPDNFVKTEARPPWNNGAWNTYFGFL